ncbi:MAG: hypothetical protein LC633_04780, partial [Desulfobulbaceae bacterium]|nr:hypothetical protein [Desulfobulbaceae bacterium]
AHNGLSVNISSRAGRFFLMSVKMPTTPVTGSFIEWSCFGLLWLKKKPGNFLILPRVILF